MLTVRGKALEAGAEGDIVGVLNIQSKRTVQGTVTGPGRVTIAADRAAVAAAAASRNRRSERRLAPSERHVEHAFASRSCVRQCHRSPPACSAAAPSLDRLRHVGEQPPLSAIENPTAQPGYKPVQMPMPTPQPASYSPNSLWRNGSRAFFKDQRAHQVGDILTVTVNINDKAVIANETQRSREQQGGFRRRRFLRQARSCRSSNTAVLPGRIFTADSTSSSDGKGSVNRPEALAHQRRRRGHAGAAERQPRGRGQAGGPRQLRDPRTDRRRHRPARGHPERQHHRLDQDRARRASPTAAAARSPTCSSRATASRCSTCCCRSELRQSVGLSVRSCRCSQSPG